MANEPGYTLEERMARVEVQLAYNTATTQATNTKVEVLSERFTSRPSWGVVTTLAIMQGVIGVLVSALVYVLVAR